MYPRNYLNCVRNKWQFVPSLPSAAGCLQRQLELCGPHREPRRARGRPCADPCAHTARGARGAAGPRTIGRWAAGHPRAGLAVCASGGICEFRSRQLRRFTRTNPARGHPGPGARDSRAAMALRRNLPARAPTRRFLQPPGCRAHARRPVPLPAWPQFSSQWHVHERITNAHMQGHAIFLHFTRNSCIIMRCRRAWLVIIMYVLPIISARSRCCALMRINSIENCIGNNARFEFGHVMHQTIPKSSSSDLAA